MKKAFTLIELLVVVLIIGILSAIALPQYRKAVLKSKFAAIVPKVHGMEQALQEYYLNNGQYKLDFDAFSLGIKGSENCAYGGAFCQLNATGNLRVEFLIGGGTSTANYYQIFCLANKNDTFAKNICSEYGTHYKTDQMDYYKIKKVDSNGTITYYGDTIPF